MKDQQPVSLQSLIDILPGHVYWYDKDGKVFGCNAQQAISAGFKSSAEFVGKNMFAIQTPENERILRETNRYVMATGQVHTAEEPYVYPDGRKAIFLSKKAPWRDVSGRPIGVIGVSFDITREKQLEDELHHAKEFAENTLRNIIDFMPGHVYWKDLNFKIQGCNKLQAQSAGVSSPKELIGKNDFELPWKDEAPLLRKVDEKVVREGVTVSAEEPSATKDGEIRTYLSQKAPLRDEQGNITGIVGISFDITEQKAAEELRIKNKIIEEKLAVMKLLSASMAHEMRTPFAAIKTMASVYERYLPKMISVYKKAMAAGLVEPQEKMDPIFVQALGEGPEDLEQITNSANLFIDMLLMKVNIDDHPQTDAPPVSIKFVVDNALSYYPFQEGDRPLVKEKIEPDFEVQCSEILMRHVLFNLLKNAIYYVKAAKKGDIHIWTELCHDKNILHFKDTGKGMAPEVLTHLFEPFFSKTHHGTGIGLAYCKMMMNSVGGDITCESKEGEYTHFQLIFPKP